MTASTHHQRGIRTRETSAGKELFVRWFSFAQVRLFAIALSCISVLFLLGVAKARTGHWSGALISFAAVPLLFLLSYPAFLRTFNHSTFTLKEGLLSVTHGPLPTLLKAPKDLPLKDLRFCIDHQRTEEHETPILRLLFLGEQGEETKILTHLPEAKLEAITAQLTQWQEEHEA